MKNKTFKNIHQLSCFAIMANATYGKCIIAKAFWKMKPSHNNKSSKTNWLGTNFFNILYKT